MFCNQCGTQIPDNSTVCPNCGTSLAQQAPVQPQPVQPQVQPVQGQPQAQPVQGQPQMQGQPMYNGQSMQGQPMYNGQPMQGQPMYNGQPMQQSNPLGFLTAKQPGEPFPMKGLFAVKNLTSKITTIDLIGVIAALVALISVFLPFISAGDSNFNLISSDMGEVGFKAGWFILLLSIAMGVLYFLRMEFLAFLCACLNFLLFIHAWTFGGIIAKVGGMFGKISLSVGFWFYLLASVALVAAPFIWMKVKKD